MNLTAFESKFQTTCCNRAGSPETGPVFASSDGSSLIIFAFAAGSTASIAASITGTSSTLEISRRRLPVMTRDTSSRSSISCACAFALRSTVSRACLDVASSNSFMRSNLIQPSIAVSGVLSSCESIARNSSFVRFASSASTRANFSRSKSSSRSFSASFRFVMSCAIVDAPMILPLVFLMGEMVRAMSSTLSSFVTRLVSNCSMRSPRLSLSRMSGISSARSGGARTETERPTISSAE